MTRAVSGAGPGAVGPGARAAGAFLATGDTFEQLGCHFGIGTETARRNRYVMAGIEARAAPAPGLADALAASGKRGACCWTAP
jgi:hypothetical protein